MDDIKINWGIGSLLMLFCLPVSSTTLEQSVMAAAHYNAGFLAALNERQAGNQAWNQGLAELLPTITLEGNYSKQDQPHAPYAAAVKRHSYSLNLFQPLFDARRIAAFKAGKNVSDIADMSFDIARQKLVSDVSDAYIDVLFQQENVSTVAAALAAYEHELKKAEAALQLGEGTRAERDEALANRDYAVARSLQKQHDLQNAQSLFSRLTGLSADRLEPFAKDCFTSRPEKNIEQVIKHVGENNIAILKAGLEVDRAKSETLAAFGGHLPVASMQVSYGGNWSRGEEENPIDTLFGTTQKTRNTLIGLNVSMPIFAGGKNLSKSRETLYRLEKAQNEFDEIYRTTLEQTRSEHNTMETSLSLIKANETAVSSAVNKVESTKYANTIGMRTSIDILNAQQKMYETQQDLSESRYRYLQSKIRYLLLTGAKNLSPAADWCTRGRIKEE